MTENERYTERVRDAFENFLVSKFIEYKPFSITADRIIADAKDRSIINYDGGLLQWMQSFASIRKTHTLKFKVLNTSPNKNNSKYLGVHFKGVFCLCQNTVYITFNSLKKSLCAFC